MDANRRDENKIEHGFNSDKEEDIDKHDNKNGAEYGMSAEQIFDRREVPHWRNQLTMRAFGVSFVLSVLFSFIVMKLNLTTGIIPSLNVPAGLLGFFFVKTWTELLQKSGFLKQPFTRQENTVIQTCVVASSGIAFSDDETFLGDSGIDNEDSKANIVHEEALIDANVTEVGTIPMSSFQNTSQSVVDNDDSEALVDVCVKPVEEFADTAAANSESSLASPSRARFSQTRQSSSKKQTTTSPKVIRVSENINKENIDNHIGPKKMKKNKNLEDFSLRTLKKLITNKLNKLEIAEEDVTLNKQPFGKIRPNLQTLSQNSVKSEETEKQN